MKKLISYLMLFVGFLIVIGADHPASTNLQLFLQSIIGIGLMVLAILLNKDLIVSYYCEDGEDHED